MAADRALTVLERALHKVAIGEEDDAYLRDAVRAAISLLGGEPVVEEDVEEIPSGLMDDGYIGGDLDLRVGW